MTPIKAFRSLVKFLRGSAGPLHIFLACLMGVMLGFVPGFNLTLVVGIVLLVAINVNIGMALLALLAGKALALALAPVTYRIGFGLIHHTPIGSAVSAMGDTPVLALLDWHYYCLLGGLVLAIPIGSALGILAGASIQKLRRALVAASDKSAFIAKLNGSKFWRLVLRVLFGKGSVAEALTAKPPLLRKKGLIVAGVLGVVLVATPIVLVDRMLAGALADALGRANGAQVDIAKAELSFFGGRVVIEGLAATDPDNPAQNIVQADRLAGDVSVADLLAKRLVIDLLEADNLQTDQPRQTPGEVYRQEQAPDEGGDFTEYFEKAKEYRKYLQHLKKVREYLEKVPRGKDGDKPQAPEDARGREYFALSAQDILPSHPALLIRKLVVNNAPIGELSYRIEGSNVSSNPRLNRQPMTIDVSDISADDPSAVGTRRKVGIGLGGPDDISSLKLLLADLPVPEMSELCPVDGQGGRASLRAEGTFSGGRLNMPMEIIVRDFNSKLKEGQSLFGLSSATSKSLIEKASELSLVGVLHGPLDRPQWQTDEKSTLAALKGSLTGAAKAELGSQLDSQIEKLGVKSPVDVGGVLGLPGLKKDDQAPSSQPAQPTEKTDPVGGLLRGLGR